MAGHSKWDNIKHKKAKEDARRGKIFTKMARLISVAAREGGPDPDTNFKLRMAIDKAKSVNVPNENIERTIKRGAGELEGESFGVLLRRLRTGRGRRDACYHDGQSQSDGGRHPPPLQPAPGTWANRVVWRGCLRRRARSASTGPASTRTN